MLMKKTTGSRGILFSEDPVPAVLSYIKVIEGNSLTPSAKNDVYSKLASSAKATNANEAMALLRGFAKIKKLDPAIAVRLYDRVEAILANASEINFGKDADLLLARYPRMKEVLEKHK